MTADLPRLQKEGYSTTKAFDCISLSEAFMRHVIAHTSDVGNQVLQSLLRSARYILRSVMQVTFERNKDTLYIPCRPLRVKKPYTFHECDVDGRLTVT